MSFSAPCGAELESAPIPFFGATEPVGGIGDSVPVHSDDKHRPTNSGKAINASPVRQARMMASRKTGIRTPVTKSTTMSEPLVKMGVK